MGRKHQPGCCGCGSGGAPCSPCTLPRSTLTLTFRMYDGASVLQGPYTASLLYIGSDQWDTGTISGGAVGTYRIRLLTCSTSGLTCTSAGFSRGGLAVNTYLCSPLSLVYAQVAPTTSPGEFFDGTLTG